MAQEYYVARCKFNLSTSFHLITTKGRLKNFGQRKKIDTRVPHKPIELNKIERISICKSHLKRLHINRFFQRLVTGDDKWNLNDNNVQKRSCRGPRVNNKWKKRDTNRVPFKFTAK